MNSDIATAAAWKPADRVTQQTNIALNEFEAALRRAQLENRHLPAGPITTALIKARGRRRLREMHIAIARVGAQLGGLEGPQGYGRPDWVGLVDELAGRDAAS